jgi:hypothetical protein
MMRSFLTRYVQGKRKTLKYEFAVLVLGVWIIFSVRLLISGDPVWITAQAGNYSTLTWAAFAFIAAAVGLQTWQNTQGPAGSTEPAYEDGALDPREPTAEDTARGGI